MTIKEKIDWILLQHGEQMYGNNIYTYHLNAVHEVLEKVWEEVVDPKNSNYNLFHKLSLACLGHDLIEDTNNSYNDVRKVLGEEVADIIYDVTNELGKNRKERATKTYQKIMNNPQAILVKICDRIANTKFSKESGSTMFKKYQEEYPDFRLTLYDFGKTSEDETINNITDKLWENLDRINEFKKGE